MREVRTAFLVVLDSLPSRVDKASDLEQLLGVSGTLAWQVYGLATSSNPLSVGKLVPGPNAVQQVLRSARNHGVPEPQLQRVHAAIEQVRHLISRHAGDRPTFVAMMNALAGEEVELIDEKTRKQAFRINSHLWGVQVKAVLRSALYYPGQSSSHIDIALISGMHGIRRLRQDAPFCVCSSRLMDGHNQLVPRQPDEQSSGLPGDQCLLPDYCSKPHPRLEHRLEGDYIATYLRNTPLGNAGEQNLYTTETIRNIDWRSDDDSQNELSHNVSIMKPMQVLVQDTLVQRDMFGLLESEVGIYGSMDRRDNIIPEVFEPETLLPMHAEMKYIGRGLSAIPTPHVPRYESIVESVCRNLGWDPDSFDAYRCIIEYPMLHTVVHERHPLPEQGNW